MAIDVLWDSYCVYKNTRTVCEDIAVLHSSLISGNAAIFSRSLVWVSTL